MDVVFAGAADVGGGHVAFVVGRFTAEQFRQVGLGCVQLLFACGLTFSGKVRTAQIGVAQTGNQTGGTVDYERFVAVACFADGNLVGKREADVVFVGAGQDVAVAFDAQAVTQFLRTGRAVVGGKGQTFVVHRVFRRDAFGDVGFGFVGQIQRIVGDTVGVFRTFADFNRTIGRLAEGGLVGVNGVLGVVAVHFFADGHVLTGNDGGGFFGGGELFVQLGDVDGVGVVRTFGYVGNLVAAVVQTGIGQRHLAWRTVRTDLQTFSAQYAVAGDEAVGKYGSSRNSAEFDIVFSLNRQLFTAAFHSDVLTLFHGHGVACGDFFAVAVCFIVRFQLPAFIGCRFH